MRRQGVPCSGQGATYNSQGQSQQKFGLCVLYTGDPPSHVISCRTTADEASFSLRPQGSRAHTHEASDP